jgi:hypothetical protein
MAQQESLVQARSRALPPQAVFGPAFTPGCAARPEILDCHMTPVSRVYAAPAGLGHSVRSVCRKELLDTGLWMTLAHGDFVAYVGPAGIHDGVITAIRYRNPNLEVEIGASDGSAVLATFRNVAEDVTF